eukprot:3095830-Rhodomonas_salina.1
MRKLSTRQRMLQPWDEDRTAYQYPGWGHAHLPRSRQKTINIVRNARTHAKSQQRRTRNKKCGHAHHTRLLRFVGPEPGIVAASRAGDAGILVVEVLAVLVGALEREPRRALEQAHVLGGELPAGAGHEAREVVAVAESPGGAGAAACVEDELGGEAQAAALRLVREGPARAAVGGVDQLVPRGTRDKVQLPVCRVGFPHRARHQPAQDAVSARRSDRAIPAQPPARTARRQ